MPPDRGAEVSLQARELREHPYRADHQRAIQRRMFQPKGLHQLMAWFVKAWRDEIPESIHGGGIEPDSELGAPRLTNDFRTYIEGKHGRVTHAFSDGRPEVGETYVTPVLWTLRWLERNRHPLIAAVLRSLGRSGGDYRGLTIKCEHGVTMSLPPEYCEAIARDALNLAWEHYREAPTTY